MISNLPYDIQWNIVNYIEDIEILNLHNLFESFLYEANMICREICIRRRIKELDSIDI